MTQRQFLRLLQAEANKSPTRWKAAERFGVSESTLSRVINGKIEPNDVLLGHFSLKRQVVYIPLPKVNSLTVDTKINIDETCTDPQV
jgi:DNA-directed RNA polymerase specialized sigma54-like protein